MHGKFVLFECLTPKKSMTEILGRSWTTSKVIEVFISPFNLYVFDPLEGTNLNTKEILFISSK